MSKEQFTALLGAGTEYQGQLSFQGTVRIDGKFTGDITSEGKLILGKDAVVQGNINVHEVVVHGTLNGEISVARRTILHKTARITGNVATPLLTMEEGAILQGMITMRPKEMEKVVSAQNLHGISREGEVVVQFGEPVIKQ